MEENRDLNRLKVVLADKKRTNKWLAEQLGKDPATVSRMPLLFPESILYSI